MKIKKNISVQDRINFVNFVVDSCEVEGKHCHALFDLMWRAAVVTWFAEPEKDEIHLENMTQDQICDFVYSFDGISIVEDPDIAEVLAGLYEACENEIKDRREEYMVVFNELTRTDPLDRIADAFESASKAIENLNDPVKLAEIAKQAKLTGRKTKTNGKKNQPKHPIKLEIAKKE